MKNKIRVGIILNSLHCSWYIFDFIEWAKKTDFIEIVDIYLIKSNNKLKNKFLDRVFSN